MIRTYKILSLLLSYPSEETYSLLPKVQKILRREQLLPTDAVADINTFTDFFHRGSLLEWQEHYVQLFDLSRTVSLYLFEHLHGESRDRGQAMVDLAGVYAENGLVLNHSELPDYLPVFLEFLARQTPANASEYLADIIDIAATIHYRLQQADNPYRYLLSAIIQLSAHKPAEKTMQRIASELPAPELDEMYEEPPVTFSNDNPCINCKSQ